MKMSDLISAQAARAYIEAGGIIAILRGDRNGAAAAMRAHIELVRGEYEVYSVSL